MQSTARRDAILGTLSGFLGLLTAITNWRTPTVTEASYTGYSATRPAITWGAAADATPASGRQRANTGVVAFGLNTGASQDIIGWGVYAAASGGSPLEMGLLSPDQPFVGVGLVSNLIEALDHGLVTDQRVFVLAAPGMVLPAGFSEGTAYFVLAAGLTADAFSLSTTSGGAAVDITVGGAAWFLSYQAVAVVGSAPQFEIGAIIVQG